MGKKREKEKRKQKPPQTAAKSNTGAALIKMLVGKVPKPREVHPETGATSHRDIISSRSQVCQHNLFFHPAAGVENKKTEKKIIMSNA